MKNARILSIDAWRDGDSGWCWNNSFTLETGVWIENPTPRRVARLLREWGYLTPHSRGRIRVEYVDDVMIEIQDKNTHEPLLAISTIH